MEETPHQWPNQTFLSAPLISLKTQHKACPDEIYFLERIFEEQAVSNQNARGKSLQCTVIAVPQLSEAGELRRRLDGRDPGSRMQPDSFPRSLLWLIIYGRGIIFLKYKSLKIKNIAHKIKQNIVITAIQNLYPLKTYPFYPTQYVALSGLNCVY